jgi:hypothetical protein
MRSPYPAIICSSKNLSFDINESNTPGFTDESNNFYSTEIFANEAYKMLFEKVEKDLN